MDRLVKLSGYVLVLYIVSVQCELTEFPQFSSPSRISLSTNRGYRDVLIAIGEAVPEDEKLIEKIKTVFTEFSSFLYQATNVYDNGVFFEEIRILVPDSWSDRDDYMNPSWETFSTSDIRVDLPPIEGGPNRNQPSTNKPTQCGAPGMYIHLTPDYITNNKIAKVYGDRDRTLTHEWGHFRWGVFDEYPRPGDLHFYAANNGNFEATRCVTAITGVKRTADGKKCVTDNSGEPDEACRFFDDRGPSETYAASLMYKQFLPEMQTFCDDVDHTDGVPAKTHNIEAPNEQNNLCAYRSVWEVLREHTDFPKDTPQTTPNNALPQINIEPSFVVVKRQFQALPTVIVLDMSGSMNSNGRLHILRQASYNLISRVLEDTQLFGIVTFNHESTIVREATTAIGINRQQSIDALPKAASGETHIGQAVLEGVRALQNSDDEDVSGSQIILLTDGAETPNVSPTLEDVTMTQLRGVTVHTIAISSSASRNLEEIANRTNGRTFFQRDNSAALFNIFSRLAIQDSSQIVEILSETFNFTDGTFTRTFAVGPFSTGQMTILVAFPELKSTDEHIVEVIKPDGSIINETSQSPDLYQFVDDFDLYQIDTQADRGMWQIRVTMVNILSPLPDAGTVYVETKRSAINEALPIEADAQWALPDVQPDQIQTLYVTVNQGYTPVANAKVEVEVSLPDNTRTKLPVWDDGVGSDVRAKDGIYSAFFTQFKGDGRYSMQVNVVGEMGVTKLMQGSRVGQGPAAVDPDQGTAEFTPKEVDTGGFERTIEGESFRCTNVEKCQADKDFYSPYRITDLRGYKETENNTAILKFTAPGDDLLHGTAAYYEIHVSTNVTLLLKQLTNTTELEYVPTELRTNETETPYVTSGNLTNPQPARSIEVFEIQLPLKGGNYSYVFSVVAVDDEGHRSQPSNFASVTAKEVVVVVVKIGPGSNLPTIVGSSLSVLFLLLLLLLLLFLLVRRRKRNEVHDYPKPKQVESGKISPSQTAVKIDISHNMQIAGQNNNTHGHMNSELTQRLQVRQTTPFPHMKGQATISSSSRDNSYTSMDGTDYDQLREAGNMVGGTVDIDHRGTAYNFVSISSQQRDNVSFAVRNLQQSSEGSYPLIQVNSRREDLKTADKVYSDPSRSTLSQDTYGIENPGFENDEHQRQAVGYKFESTPSPSGPPPRPPKQSLYDNDPAIGHRQVDLYPITEDVTPVTKPALPPKVPTRDDDDSDSEDSDKFDYEPVANPNSNSQLTMNMLQPKERAPLLPSKRNDSDNVMPPRPVPRSQQIPRGFQNDLVGTTNNAGRPVVPPYDSDDDDTIYDDPPTNNISSTIGNGVRPIAPPREINENERPYDEPPPSHGHPGHDDDDSDDSDDYEPVADVNAVLGLSSS